MSLLLASIYSNRSPGAGLLVYDPDDSSARYVQLVNFSGIPTQMHQIRGISIAGDRLYAVAPCALIIFRLDARKIGPIFYQEKIICKPEWILGDSQQGNLHAVYASEEKQRVYISFNAQCAIEVFDLDGNFIRRRHLWDIAPEVFSMPAGRTDKNFQFGFVRHIFKTEQKELMLTTSELNGKDESAVISYNTGRIHLGKTRECIHGGLLHNNTLYLCGIRKGKVLAYKWPSGDETAAMDSVRHFSPRITDARWQFSTQKTRGLAVVNNRIFCGVCYFQKPKSNQIPARMVEFELQSGEQTREHWLPSFKELEEPHIYAMLPVTGELRQAVALRDGPAYYQGRSLISPIWTVPEISTEFLGNKLGNKILQSDRSGAPHLKDSHSPAIADNEAPDESANGVQGPPTVIFDNVSICFERAARKFLSLNSKMRRKKLFWALRDISFTVYQGETLGIIGRNGSGKSTLSMVCSGVLVPDNGKVVVKGRSQLLALGVGFNLEMSGRENVFISGSLLGLSKKELKDKMEEIEKFAELGEFMDEPVRTYSSGMRSRLGFAVATAVKPDILILDEVMSTGDKAFRAKAMKRMRDMRSLARSVIVVSHNPGQLRKLSTKVLWLEKGRIVKLGEPREVLNSYDHFCQNPARWFEKHPDLSQVFAAGEITNDG
jgi:ABC-type polysaccharide/polyol phosphate transport system ATPase subunit